MDIKDFKIGMKVIAVNGISGWHRPEVCKVTEINTDGTVVVEDDEGGCVALLSELEPLPEMPDQVVVDTRGFIRETINSNTGMVIDQNFHAGDDDPDYCYIKEDVLTYDEPELTPEQIAVIKSRMKEV